MQSLLPCCLKAKTAFIYLMRIRIFACISCNSNKSTLQDEVSNFQPKGSDLDYPGKLQQRHDQAVTEQNPLTHENGNTPAAAVPQQNTDSQVPVCNSSSLQ